MSDSQITPHPIWAQRLAAIAERLEKSGVTGVAAELLDVAASITSRGEEFRRRADELRRRGDQGSDPEREHKRHGEDPGAERRGGYRPARRSEKDGEGRPERRSRGGPQQVGRRHRVLKNALVGRPRR